MSKCTKCKQTHLKSIYENTRIITNQSAANTQHQTTQTIFHIVSISTWLSIYKDSAAAACWKRAAADVRISVGHTSKIFRQPEAAENTIFLSATAENCRIITPREHHHLSKWTIH